MESDDATSAAATDGVQRRDKPLYAQPRKNKGMSLAQPSILSQGQDSTEYARMSQVIGALRDSRTSNDSAPLYESIDSHDESLVQQRHGHDSSDRADGGGYAHLSHGARRYGDTEDEPDGVLSPTTQAMRSAIDDLERFIGSPQTQDAAAPATQHGPNASAAETSDAPHEHQQNAENTSAGDSRNPTLTRVRSVSQHLWDKPISEEDADGVPEASEYSDDDDYTQLDKHHEVASASTMSSGSSYQSPQDAVHHPSIVYPRTRAGSAFHSSMSSHRAPGSQPGSFEEPLVPPRRRQTMQQETDTSSIASQTEYRTPSQVQLEFEGQGEAIYEMPNVDPLSKRWSILEEEERERTQTMGAVPLSKSLETSSVAAATGQRKPRSNTDIGAVRSQDTFEYKNIAQVRRAAETVLGHEYAEPAALVPDRLKHPGLRDVESVSRNQRVLSKIWMEESVLDGDSDADTSFESTGLEPIPGLPPSELQLHTAMRPSGSSTQTLRSLVEEAKPSQPSQPSALSTSLTASQSKVSSIAGNATPTDTSTDAAGVRICVTNLLDQTKQDDGQMEEAAQAKRGYRQSRLLSPSSSLKDKRDDMRQVRVDISDASKRQTVLLPFPKPEMERAHADHVPQTCSTFTSELMGRSMLERAGYLYLRTRLKRWRKRYVVLQGGSLSVFKTPSSPAPVWTLKIDSHVVVQRLSIADQTGRTSRCLMIESTDGVAIFAADSEDETEIWINELSSLVKAMKRSTAARGRISGWVIKSRHGFQKRRFMTLAGGKLFYARHENAGSMGEIDLADCDLRIVDESDLSDTEEEQLPEAAQQLRQSIEPKHGLIVASSKGEYVFLFTTKEERNRWAYFAGQVVARPVANLASRFETLAMSVSSITDLTRAFWQHEVFRHVDEDIDQSLTMLPTQELQEAACGMWRSLRMFCNREPGTGKALTYHIKLIQSLCHLVMKKRELLNELFCQLIKWLANHPEPSSSSALQAWRVLALIGALDSPSFRIHRFIRSFLKVRSRGNSREQEMAKYALECMTATAERGGRRYPPSRVEVMSVLARNPREYSYPMSIPIFLANGSHYLIGFEPSTTFSEMNSRLAMELGIRPQDHSGFAVLVNDPQSRDQMYATRAMDKVCDILAKWERMYSENNVGKLEQDAVPMLKYVRRLWLSPAVGHETPVEAMLVAYQLNDALKTGRYRARPEQAIKMTVRLAQMERGDLDAQPNPEAAVVTTMRQLMPRNLLDLEGKAQNASIRPAQLRQFRELWKSLAGRDATLLAREYLRIAAEWPYYGYTSFSGVLLRDRANVAQREVSLLVGEKKILIMTKDDETVLEDISFERLKHFGASAGDFRICLSMPHPSDPQRHLRKTIVMSLEHKSEATLLIASYINVILHREGITSKARSVHQVVYDLESSSI